MKKDCYDSSKLVVRAQGCSSSCMSFNFLYASNYIPPHRCMSQRPERLKSFQNLTKDDHAVIHTYGILAES